MSLVKLQILKERLVDILLPRLVSVKNQATRSTQRNQVSFVGLSEYNSEFGKVFFSTYRKPLLKLHVQNPSLKHYIGLILVLY